ncbi:hypothetical protein CHUAL_000027 [Chamberlinius hualienensis]
MMTNYSGSDGIPKIEALNSKNYATWSIKVSALLKSRNLYHILVHDKPTKNENDEASMNHWREWQKKNDQVYGLVVLTLSTE